MATSFDDVEDLALIVINDYRLSKLYSQSVDNFYTYLDGFLIKAIPEFVISRTDLSYDLDERTFTEDLSTMEQNILADLLVIQWYLKDNQTYALYRQHLQSSGSFKNHSEAQNLKENSTYLDKLREELQRHLISYQMEDLDTYLD